jgi:hypothetical protein
MLIDDSSWISSPRVPDHMIIRPAAAAAPGGGQLNCGAAQMELLKMRVAQMRAAELPGLLNSLMLPHKRNLSELFFDLPSLLGCE